MKCPDEYKLTDPVVHSVDMIFGKTDLGVVGMERVLANHNCNLICQQLGLQNPMTSVYMPGNIQGLELNNRPLSTTKMYISLNFHASSSNKNVMESSICA